MGDGASLAEEFGTCSVQECEEVLCFGNVGAVAGHDLVAVANNAVSITDEKAKEGEKGELGERNFKFARDV